MVQGSVQNQELCSQRSWNHWLSGMGPFQKTKISVNMSEFRKATILINGHNFFYLVLPMLNPRVHMLRWVLYTVSYDVRFSMLF